MFIVFGNQDFTHTVIACNTAHLLIDEISTILSARPLSLIEVTEHTAKKEGIQSIGLLASPNTIQSKLHRQLFENQRVIVLDEKGRNQTSKIIHDVITGKQEHTHILSDQISQLVSQGAEIVILGCTELSVVNHTSRFKNVLDPLEVISKKIMEHEV